LAASPRLALNLRRHVDRAARLDEAERLELARHVTNLTFATTTGTASSPFLALALSPQRTLVVDASDSTTSSAAVRVLEMT
jgi:hypothetical protein